MMTRINLIKLVGKTTWAIWLAWREYRAAERTARKAGHPTQTPAMIEATRTLAKLNATAGELTTQRRRRRRRGPRR
jgi:type VI protein secretion system component VasK